MSVDPGRLHKAKILIVEDHPIVQEGLDARIAAQSDMEVCGTTAKAAEALAMVDRLEPDLVLIDIWLTHGNGLELVQRLKARHPGLKMLVLSVGDESVYAERALAAGAHGYIEKRQVPSDILNAVRTVLRDGYYTSDQVRDRLFDHVLNTPAPDTLSIVDGLSNRELQVFKMIGDGRNTTSIAEELHLSPHTIDSHREHIKAKLGLESGLELQRTAMQWTLAPDPDISG